MNPAIKLLLLIAAALLLTGASCFALVGCDQKPIPINPKPGAPCGEGAYFQCPSGICCFARTEYCGQKGHACNENMCCFSGEPGPTWGSSPEGGAVGRQGTSPEDARKAGPR